MDRISEILSLTLRDKAYLNSVGVLLEGEGGDLYFRRAEALRKPNDVASSHIGQATYSSDLELNGDQLSGGRGLTSKSSPLYATPISGLL